MGIVRFFLALVVVVAHSGLGEGLGNSRLAVQTFFMISGFLMSYIIRKEAAYAKVLPFYVNRALRIYPIYWIVAAVTAAVWAVAGDRFALARHLGGASSSLLLFSNVFIFGQDMVMFVSERAGRLVLAPDLSPAGLWRFLLVPPAWSLSIELTFYLLAPFVLRRAALVGCLFGLSVLAMAIGFHAGLDRDPWTYRFFPFDLSLFLLGSIVERTMLRHVKRFPAMTRWSPAVILGLFLIYAYIPLPEPVRSAVCLAVIAATLPFIFTFQHGRRWDALIGDFSYPLYICHFLIVEIAGKMAVRFGGVPPAMFGGLAVLLSIGSAIALERMVARPVERVRRRIRRDALPVDAV